MWGVKWWISTDSKKKKDKENSPRNGASADEEIHLGGNSQVVTGMEGLKAANLEM